VEDTVKGAGDTVNDAVEDTIDGLGGLGGLTGN
jgi:hypothetical protein